MVHANDTDPAAHGAALQQHALTKLSLLCELLRTRGLMVVSPKKGREIEALIEWAARTVVCQFDTPHGITFQLGVCWEGVDGDTHSATIRVTRCIGSAGVSLTLSDLESF